MNTKQLAIQAIESLPDDVGFQKIKEEIDLIEGVEAGFRQAEEGKSVTLEEARKAVDSWFSKSSSQS